MLLNRRGFFGRLMAVAAGAVALFVARKPKTVPLSEQFSVPMTWPKADDLKDYQVKGDAVYLFTSDGIYRNGERIS